MSKKYASLTQLEELKEKTEGMKNNLISLVWRIAVSPKWYIIILDVDGGGELGRWTTSDWSKIKDFCSTHDNHGNEIYGLGMTDNELARLTGDYIKRKREKINTEKLITKIDKSLEKKAMETGKMGTESVSVTMELTEEEKEKFMILDGYDDSHYWWEFDDLTLNITYTEDIS